MADDEINNSFESIYRFLSIESVEHTNRKVFMFFKYEEIGSYDSVVLLRINYELFKCLMLNIAVNWRGTTHTFLIADGLWQINLLYCSQLCSRTSNVCFEKNFILRTSIHVKKIHDMRSTKLRVKFLILFIVAIYNLRQQSYEI